MVVGVHDADPAMGVLAENSSPHSSPCLGLSSQPLISSPIDGGVSIGLQSESLEEPPTKLSECVFRGNHLQATLDSPRSCHYCRLSLRGWALSGVHKWAFSCRVHHLELNFNNPSGGCLPA